jgi:hypothetical protein
MDFNIRVDGQPTQNWIEQAFRDQLPFATSLAVNQTAKAVQQAIRAHIAAAFTIRRPWVLQGVVIPRFSDKRDNPIQATVAIDPARRFLRKFEAGGTKVGSATEPIAIPGRAIRPAFPDLPALDLYPKNLRLVSRHGVTGILPAKSHVTRRGVTQIQGKQRTFVLDGATMYGVRVSGIYQRFGPGRHDFRLLWTYKRQIPIPARLLFEATAAATVQQVWPELFRAAYDRAIRTAR